MDLFPTILSNISLLSLSLFPSGISSPQAPFSDIKSNHIALSQNSSSTVLLLSTLETPFQPVIMLGTAVLIPA
jgi:hypothetical protein